MMARLGQNLGIKLLSLICSYALFLYVHKQQSSELQYQVPLTVLLDPNTRVTDPAVMHRMVSVTLSGPAERLKDLARHTKAVANLRGRGSGSYTQPVEVTTGPDSATDLREGVVVNWTPHVIGVQLEEESSRRMPVQTVFNVQPPPGFSVVRVSAAPSVAVVTGWEGDLRRVKRLQAIVNSLGSGSLSDVDLVVPVRAVDVQGLEVVSEGIQVQPPTIKVRAILQQTIWSKPVYVSPTVGEIPATVRLQRISVTPRRLTLRGAEDVVGAVQFLETEPITIPSAPGLVDREVRVILPPGVKTEERPRVRVVIALQGGNS
jgi:YbbR domain-containing protein